MAMHPRAGQKAEQKDLHNIPVLISNYFHFNPIRQIQTRGGFRYVRASGFLR